MDPHCKIILLREFVVKNEIEEKRVLKNMYYIGRIYILSWFVENNLYFFIEIYHEAWNIPVALLWIKNMNLFIWIIQNFHSKFNYKRTKALAFKFCMIKRGQILNLTRIQELIVPKNCWISIQIQENSLQLKQSVIHPLLTIFRVEDWEFGLGVARIWTEESVRLVWKIIREKKKEKKTKISFIIVSSPMKDKVRVWGTSLTFYALLD